MGGKAPQVRTGPKSLPAGRLGRGKTALPAGRLGHGKTSLPAGRLGRGNPQHQAQKKESRLIAESGLSKRGSYLLSHLV
ncbi:MAG: hypothetical protein MR588_07870 [Bacteroidales bacterium]|nr:hypothetical protein [Bacteroidales bacterium]